ncbi:serine protease inhibitor [Streptomyces sp. NPDC097619]|uniref:serine protease inhibitor n=1 Tax=Streptomyces sp. NPDC097619 TaxID=3157228 RepID=UPI003329CF34
MNKEEWPELVSRSSEDAVEQIGRDRPGVDIVVVRDGDMVTADFRQDRVRVFVSPDRKVTRPPRVG